MAGGTIARHFLGAQRQATMLSINRAHGNRYVQRLLAGPLAAAGEIVGNVVNTALALQLGGSVGQGGDNKPPDVMVVRTRLQMLRFLDANPAGAQAGADGGLDSLIAAIKRYQSEVLGFSRPDGRVDPGGKTLRALDAWRAASSTGSPTATHGPAGSTTPATETETPDAERSGPTSTPTTIASDATVDSLNNPTINAIVADLKRVAGEQTLGAKKEETGGGREKLVKAIADARGKIKGLRAADLGVDEPTLAAVRARLYQMVANLTPYYAQGANADILWSVDKKGKKTKAAGRTCNVTSISMTLEGLGKGPDAFKGDKRLLGNIATHYAGVLTTADPTSLRLPDFLQLVVIYVALIGPKGDPATLNAQAESDPPAFVAAIEKARDAAARLIVLNNVFNDITSLFGVTATMKVLAHHDALDAFGKVTRGAEAARKKNAGKSAEELVGSVSDYYAARPEKEITKLTAEIDTLKAKASGASGKDLTKLTRAIGQKEKALARQQGLLTATQAATSPAEMEKVLSIAKYKASVMGPMNDLLGAGKQVVVSLENHFVRLQSVDDSGVVVDDPNASQKNLKLTWEAARALGYFKRYTIME